jgi:hypothetical protein
MSTPQNAKTTPKAGITEHSKTRTLIRQKETEISNKIEILEKAAREAAVGFGQLVTAVTELDSKLSSILNKLSPEEKAAGHDNNGQAVNNGGAAPVLAINNGVAAQGPEVGQAAEGSGGPGEGGRGPGEDSRGRWQNWRGRGGGRGGPWRGRWQSWGWQRGLGYKNFRPY